MTEEIKYTVDEANKYFAIRYNNKIWQLLERPAHTEDEANEMINLAHASLLHWSKSPGCKKVNLQRGEYMISLAYINAKRKEPALYHANRCKHLTETQPEENEDFDMAHSFLIMAAALSLNGDTEEAGIYLKEAKKLGDNIKNTEDKRIFMGDLKMVGSFDSYRNE